jgi:hypothetical protein
MLPPSHVVIAQLAAFAHEPYDRNNIYDFKDFKVTHGPSRSKIMYPQQA